jgi:Family of unknown function (DUF6932)
MPIPEFVDSVLPEGVHDCTMAEIEERFGGFRKSDQRIKLTDRLKQYLAAAKQSGIVKAVIVNGSYVMNVDEPGDIDLIAVLRPAFDPAQELKPHQENVIDRSAIRRDYRFDGFAYKEGSLGLQKLIIDFGVVPEKHEMVTARSRKGMVRVNL